LLQICRYIHINIANIDLPQQFIASPRMNTRGLQPSSDAFAQHARQPVKLAADGRLVNPCLASNVGQGALIEIIGCEQKPLLMTEFGQR